MAQTQSAMPGLGDEFRAAREARHLSLSDVAEQLHIRSVYLEGIEDDDWSAIAAPVYARGFIRAYARFLGMDADSAVAYYNASQRGTSEPPSVVETPPPQRRRRRGQPSPWLWALALAAAILVGLVGYNLFQLPGETTGATAVVDAKHAGPGASAAATLELRLTGKSWLSVSVDGSRRLVGTFPAGTHKAFHGRSADVRADDAGAVELMVNGKDLGTLGSAGNAADRSISLAEE